MTGPEQAPEGGQMNLGVYAEGFDGVIPELEAFRESGEVHPHLTAHTGTEIDLDGTAYPTDTYIPGVNQGKFDV